MAEILCGKNTQCNEMLFCQQTTKALSKSHGVIYGGKDFVYFSASLKLRAKGNLQNLEFDEILLAEKL